MKQEIAPHLGIGRLIVLISSALILSLSFIMSVFAPLPLALSFFLYNKGKAFLFTMLGFVVSLGISRFLLESYTFVFFYVFALIIALLIVGIVKAKVKPARGLVYGGISFYVTTISLFLLGVFTLNIPVKEQLVTEINKIGVELKKQEATLLQDGGEDAVATLASFSQPEKLATELLLLAPSYYFMGLLFVLWANLFLALRARRMLLNPNERKMSEQSLLKFKVADQVIWLLAGSLFMAIWGNDIGYPDLEFIGVSLIKVIGIFYFFQGFGLYIEFLNKIRIFGIIRTVLVIFTVMTAAWLIALVGLFDMWVDFRKYLRKKS